MNYSQNSYPNNNSFSASPEYRYSGFDTLFAWISLIVGFLISKSLPVVENSLGGMIVVLVLFAFGIAYIKLSGRKLKASSWIVMAISLVFSIGLINISNGTVKGFLYLFNLVCFLNWIYTSFNMEKFLGKRCLNKLMRSVFVVPFSNLGRIFPAFVIRDKETSGAKVYKTVLFIILGLLIAIIPTSIVISLLSYDSGFVAILEEIFYFTPEEIIEFIGDSILGSFFAMIVFGAVYGSKISLQEPLQDNEDGKANLKVIPKPIICATVSPVLFIYVVFFVSQWDYYVSAFTKVLPENLSYATYAREGFFQLCAVCVFNALMLLLFHSFIKTNGKKYDFVKILYSSIISIFTLVLVATALSKMLLYIDSYGLTRLRVYSSWMILLLAVFFVIALLYQFIPRIPLVSSLVVTFVVFFGLITIPNVDYMIANYNVSAYIDGDLKTVDVYTLEKYGESAVPALFDLYDNLKAKEELTYEEKKLLEETKRSLNYVKSTLIGDSQEKGVFNFSIPRHRAEMFYEHKPID